VKELYQQRVRETSLNVTRWEIDSIRRKDITKSGCRVFRDGLLGLAGTLGEAEEVTWREAEANLADRVPYPYPLTQGAARSLDLREESKSPAQITAEIADCLRICRERYPRLALSNKAMLIDIENHLTNDAGTALHFADRFTVLALLVKHVDSANIMDSVLEWIVRRFEPARFLGFADQMLATFETPAVLPATDKPLVVCSPDLVISKLQEELSGRKIGRQASLFTGKLGQDLFSRTFSLDRDATADAFGEAFFDMEGTVLSGDKVALIEQGRVIRPYADKKNAAEYDFALTASAGGAYDDVPSLDSHHLSIRSSGKSLRELLAGELAIYVVMASGGDFTSEGQFATPVQVAMLTDGEQMLGRLPEFSLSGSLYDLFGQDFVGAAADTPFNHEHPAVFRMARS
jgi:PmbA protein